MRIDWHQPGDHTPRISSTHKPIVLVDQHEVSHVIIADEERGYVLAYILRAGSPYIDYRAENVRRHIIRGKVQIKFIKAKTRIQVNPQEKGLTKPELKELRWRIWLRNLLKPGGSTLESR